ncbi:MAG: AcrR family transcriptional regulator [Paracoccaceae bacterium]|jgi:AcrR family transcriptional regulator
MYPQGIIMVQDLARECCLGRGRPLKTTKANLASRAMEIYWFQGLSKVSLNEMSRQLDLAKPSIYRTFGSGDGLMAAALSSYSPFSECLALLEAKKSLKETLDILFDEVIKLTSEHPEGCLLLQTQRFKDQLGDETSKVLNDYEKKIYQKIINLLKMAIVTGEVQENLKLDVAANLILAQFGNIQWALSIGLSQRSTKEVTKLALQSLTNKVL